MHWSAKSASFTSPSHVNNLALFLRWHASFALCGEVFRHQCSYILSFVTWWLKIWWWHSYCMCFLLFPSSDISLGCSVLSAPNQVLSIHTPSIGSTWSTAGERLGCLGAAHNAVHFSHTKAFQISFQLLPTVSTSKQKGGETGRERESERKREGWWEGRKDSNTAGCPSLGQTQGEVREWGGRYHEKTDYGFKKSPTLLFYLTKCIWWRDVLGCCKLKMFSSPVIPWLIYFHSK